MLFQITWHRVNNVLHVVLDPWTWARSWHLNPASDASAPCRPEPVTWTFWRSSHVTSEDGKREGYVSWCVWSACPSSGLWRHQLLCVRARSALCMLWWESRPFSSFLLLKPSFPALIIDPPISIVSFCPLTLLFQGPDRMLSLHWVHTSSWRICLSQIMARAFCSPAQPTLYLPRGLPAFHALQPLGFSWLLSISLWCFL